MISKPRFSFPKRLDAGTETLQNSIKVEPDARTPELCIWRRETPWDLRGMMRTEMPLAPGLPVRTAVVQ